MPKYSAARMLFYRSVFFQFRLAALQQSGNNDWRKRVSRLSPDEDVTNVITATKNRINVSEFHLYIIKSASANRESLRIRI